MVRANYERKGGVSLRLKVEVIKNTPLSPES